jgi:hypothetical protein
MLSSADSLKTRSTAPHVQLSERPRFVASPESRFRRLFPDRETLGYFKRQLSVEKRHFFEMLDAYRRKRSSSLRGFSCELRQRENEYRVAGFWLSNLRGQFRWNKR